MPKTAAQLNQEIEAILAAEGVVTLERLAVRRARDFRDSGLYDLHDESGRVVARIFRDPESRDWYEEDSPGDPQTHFSGRWRGGSQVEAVASVLRRRAARRP